MAIQSKLGSLIPARDRFRQEITLVSGGYYAKDKFPGGKITVFPWDSKMDEWLIERIRAGNANDNLVMEAAGMVCDLKGLPLKSMLAGDALTVVMVARSMLDQMTVTYDAKCPECSYSSLTTLKVPEQLGRKGEKSADYPGYDIIQLPESGDVVKTRPLTVGDHMAVNERSQDMRAKAGDATALLISTLVSVNDSIADNLDEWITYHNALPPSDVLKLREHADNTDPGLDTIVKHVCDRCKAKFDRPLQLNRDFFRRRG